MDLQDNELEPDSDGQAYYSEKYDDNSLASGCNLGSDNVSNVVEPALNVSYPSSTTDFFRISLEKNSFKSNSYFI